MMLLISHVLDIDECFTGMTSCDENADCVDNDGSYECICRIGYTGNGLSSCIGISICISLLSYF